MRVAHAFDSVWILLCGAGILPVWLPAAEPFDAIMEEQIAAITYEDCKDDSGRVAPLAKNLEHLQGDPRKRFDEWLVKLEKWDVLKAGTALKVRKMIGLCAFVDQIRGEFEAEVACVVFERLKRDVPKEQLIKASAWVALKPTDGETLTTAPELGFEGKLPEEKIRARSVLYAKKLLGRLLGKLPAK